MPLIVCTRCGGGGRLRRPGYTAKCSGCKGVGRRPAKPAPNRRDRPTASPWGLTPLVKSARALRNWDWRGAAERIAAVNEVRAAKGADPLPIPKDPPA